MNCDFYDLCDEHDEHDEKKILSSPAVSSVNRRATDFLFFFAKLRMAPLGVGWLFWQRKEELPEDLVFWVSRLAFAIEPASMKNRKKSGGFQIHTMGKRKHLTEMISKICNITITLATKNVDILHLATL